MPLVLDEEFSKKLLNQMFALLAIFFRILETFDLNTSFVHEMDLFFTSANSTEGFLTVKSNFGKSNGMSRAENCTEI